MVDHADDGRVTGLGSVLAESSIEELRERARRIACSQVAMQDAIAELEAEQSDLKAENFELSQGIEAAITHLKTEHVAPGTPSPESAFFGDGISGISRMWDQVRSQEVHELQDHVSSHFTNVSSSFSDLMEGMTPRSQNNVSSPSLRDQFASRCCSIYQVGSGPSASADFIPEPSWETHQGGHDSVFADVPSKVELQKISEKISCSVSGAMSMMSPCSTRAAPSRPEMKPDSRRRSLGDWWREDEDVEHASSPVLVRAAAQEEAAYFVLNTTRSRETSRAFSILSGTDVASAISVPTSLEATDTASIAHEEPPPACSANDVERSKEPDANIDKVANERTISRSTTDSVASSETCRKDSAKEIGADVGEPLDHSTEAIDCSIPSPLVTTSAAQPDLSSLLIEVQLSLSGDYIGVCQVRSADRCRAVAKGFVEEHSLKEYFEAPLLAYLSTQEAAAETFPVMLEADLMEIRQEYQSKSLSS